MFIIPKPGCTLRDPVTKQPIPAEGAEVQATSYWTRAIMRGDATERPATELEHRAGDAAEPRAERYPNGQE